MPRGRPPKPGTAEEKAAARRERVRQNVRALRERRKQKSIVVEPPPNTPPSLVWMSQSSRETSEVNDVSSDDSNTVDEVETFQSSPQASGQLAVLPLPGAKLQVERARIPWAPDSTEPYAASLLATFRKQFLPDASHLPEIFDPTQGNPCEKLDFLWTPCAFWVTNAFNLASNHGAETLRTGLLAVATTLKAYECGDDRLRIASFDLYRKSLQGIRKTLEVVRSHPPKDKTTLYLACHAAAMFELMQNSSLRATLHHVQGIGQLIEFLGDNRTQSSSSVPFLLLQDYRMLEMNFCLKYRYESTLSKRKRQQNPRLSSAVHRDPLLLGPSASNHSMLIAITDTADEICSVMVELDQLKQLDLKSIDETCLEKLVNKLSLILTAFDMWTIQLEARHLPTLVSEPESGPEGKSFRFTNFEVGAAWVFSFTVKAFGAETSIEATALLGAVESCQTRSSDSDGVTTLGDQDFATLPSAQRSPRTRRLQYLRSQLRRVLDQLVQSLSYFFQTDKGMVGQALGVFPLDTATSLLTKEWQRLEDDLVEAQMDTAGIRNELWYGEVQANLERVNEALLFCQQMQKRAQDFGLPTFYTP